MEQDIEEAEAGDGHSGEVNGCQHADVVVAQRPPGLGESGVRGLGGINRETLRSPISMPSLSNSPRMLGAPQPTLDSPLWRIRFLISGVPAPFFGLRGREFQHQRRRNPWRWQ